MLRSLPSTWDTTLRRSCAKVASRLGPYPYLLGAIAAAVVAIAIMSLSLKRHFGLPIDLANTLAVIELGLLAGLLVLAGSVGRTVEAQQHALQEGGSQISHLLAQSDSLQRRLDAQYVRTAETHEAFLRRVGSELHDGPAQLIAFALLRLDALSPGADRSPSLADYERIKAALTDSLADIRSISAGLILPELEPVSPADVLRLAALNHERRTGTRVVCEIESLPLRLSPTLKSCLYRFTQGALNNAYQHAGGLGQTVRGTHRDGVVEIAISDTGSGFDPGAKSGQDARLGLIGMRDRVNSLGGTFDLSSRPGVGTRVTARFEVRDAPGA